MNISTRRTTASVPWNTVGSAELDQQIPDLSWVIQEIVNLPDWTAGNPLAVIIDGAAKRVAESFNGVSSAGPPLHITYVLNFC